MQNMKVTDQVCTADKQQLWEQSKFLMPMAIASLEKSHAQLLLAKAAKSLRSPMMTLEV